MGYENTKITATPCSVLRYTPSNSIFNLPLFFTWYKNRFIEGLRLQFQITCRQKLFFCNHQFSTYAKFPEKQTFLIQPTQSDCFNHCFHLCRRRSHFQLHHDRISYRIDIKLGWWIVGKPENNLLSWLSYDLLQKWNWNICSFHFINIKIL